jgi:hypothetical protein
MDATQWLLVAAAKGLQGYVLRSDPLQEMIGASELIEQLPRCAGRAGPLVYLLPDTGYDVLTDASGAVRLLLDDEAEAQRLARLWPLLAGQFAPGLEVAVALVEVTPNGLGAAIQEAEHEVNRNRNRPSVALPTAGPWVARNRRTGLPAAKLVPALEEEDRRTGRQDAVDEESARKRAAARLTAPQTLLEKVVPPEHPQLLDCGTKEQERQFRKRWPLDLTKLAFSDNSYLAIIHADANGLGAAMMACMKQLQGKSNAEAAQTYKALCKAIEDASQAAAQAAMRRVIEVTLAAEAEENRRTGQNRIFPIPVRPIVCAGEDFTVVIQARHAIQFTADYLAALETQTKARFGEPNQPGSLRQRIPGLEPLTACAGVVFCKSHFPFSRAYALAERLCAFAKKRTERKASALAFLRIKSALQPSDDYEAIVAHAFEAGGGADRVALTMNPYQVGEAPANGLPALADLRELVKALRQDSIPRSGVRGLVSRAYEGKAAADQAFERLKLVVHERDDAAWQALESSLKKLTGDGLWKPLSAPNPGKPTAATPLYDALELLHLDVTFAEPNATAATP